jgi:hypothetical protein
MKYEMKKEIMKYDNVSKDMKEKIKLNVIKSK